MYIHVCIHIYISINIVYVSCVPRGEKVKEGGLISLEFKLIPI